MFINPNHYGVKYITQFDKNQGWKNQTCGVNVRMSLPLSDFLELGGHIFWRDFFKASKKVFLKAMPLIPTPLFVTESLKKNFFAVSLGA